jgi:hypothetical protein
MRYVWRTVTFLWLSHLEKWLDLQIVQDTEDSGNVCLSVCLYGPTVLFRSFREIANISLDY